MSAGADKVVQKLDQLLNVNLRMEKLLEKQDKKGGDKGGAGAGGSSLSDQDVDKIASLSTAMAELVKALNEGGGVDPEVGKDLAKVVVNFSEGIQDALKNIDEKKLEQFTKFTEVVLNGASKFVARMALVAILVPIAMIGTVGFSLMLLTMTKILQYAGKVDKDTMEGIGSLLKMGKGIAIFMLVMIGISFVSPMIAKGALVFTMVILGLSLVLRVAERIAGDGEGLNKGPLGSLMKLARGLAIFALLLIGFNFVGPLMASGFLVFSMVILGLGVVLRIAEFLAGDGTGLNKGPLGALMKLVKGIALFAVMLIALNFVGPLMAQGFLVFALVILGLAIVLRIAETIAGDGTGLNKGPLGALMKMAKAILIFSLVFILIGQFFVKQFAIGALVVVLSILALSVVLMVMGIPIVKKGSRNLRHVAISLVIFVAALLLYAMLVQPKLTWEGIAMLGAVIGVMALIGTLLGIPPMNRWAKSGAAALIELGIALAIFTVGLAIYAQLAAPKLTWENIAMLGAVIGVMALIGTVLGIPPIAGFAMAGAAVLVVLGAAFLVFSAGLVVFAAAASKFKSNSEVLRAGLLIATIGGTFAALALASIFIGIGAAAMIVAAAALLPISMGLAIWKASGVDQNYSRMADSLETVLPALGWGMTGIGKPDGFLGWLKLLPKVASYAAAVAMGSAAMVVAGAALIPISIGLSIFKYTKWGFADTMNLDFALSAIGGAFARLSYGGTLPDGRDYTLDDVENGIWATMWMGTNLVGLAQGIQALANMNYTEYEWDDKTKKLEPKRKVKLTREDVRVAADNAAYMISSLVQPLAAFGQLFSGSFTGENRMYPGLDPIGVILGINSLKSLGVGLASLATGTEAWANMSYWEYGLVYNPESKMKELRPIAKKKLSVEDTAKAAINIAMVLSSLVSPVAAFGAIMAMGDAAAMANPMGGILVGLGVGKNPVEKGIEGIGTLGKSLGSLASGVRDWANLAYWEYALQYNPKTKMNELRLSAKQKLTFEDIKQASINIAHVITAMIKPVTQWGAIMMGGEVMGAMLGPFSQIVNKGKNPIEKGITGIGTLGNSIKQLAEGVKSFASMQFFEYTTQKDPKTGLDRLVATKAVKVDGPMLRKASENIAMVISMMGNSVMDFIDQIDARGGTERFDEALDLLVYMQKAMGNLFKSMLEIYGNGKDIDLLYNNTIGAWHKQPSLWHHLVHSPADALGRFAQWEGKMKEGSVYYMNLLDKLHKGYAKIYNFLYETYKDGKKIDLLSKNFKVFIENIVLKYSTPEKLANFTIFLRLMKTQIHQLHQLARAYMGMDFTLRPVLVVKYDAFTRTTERLAKIATPFEKFVKSFGDMAKHMGVFATNFNVMNPESIIAFKDWTDSMVEISKVNVSNSGGIVDFINNTVSGAFGLGNDPSVDPNKKPQDYTEEEKKKQLASGGNKPGGGGDKGGDKGGSNKPITAKVDTAALAAAIKGALKEITVENLTVTGEFKKR